MVEGAGSGTQKGQFHSVSNAEDGGSGSAVAAKSRYRRSSFGWQGCLLTFTCVATFLAVMVIRMG